MDDARIWEFEDSLWRADPDHYARAIADDCLMVVPAPPFALRGRDAIAAVSGTPRWTEVTFSERQVSRPQEGLIVIAYHVSAAGAGTEPYAAWCTSVYRRRGHDDWEVVQHQQTPPLVVGG